MSIEKISASELNEFKHQLEIEQKLPKTNSFINEKADLFMAETESILSEEKLYQIDPNSGYIIIPIQEEQRTSSAPTKKQELNAKNLEIIKRNAAKLKKLGSPEEFIKAQLVQGVSEQSAQEKYINTLLKHIKGFEAKTNLTDEELDKQIAQMEKE